jgi:hypothetical protein
VSTESVAGDSLSGNEEETVGNKAGEEDSIEEEEEGRGPVEVAGDSKVEEKVVVEAVRVDPQVEIVDINGHDVDGGDKGEDVNGAEAEVGAEGSMDEEEEEDEAESENSIEGEAS